MSYNSEKILKNYINKILDIQQREEEKNLTNAELKQIAFEMGLDEDDWQNLQSEIKNSIIKANHYIEHRNYKDAIQELEQVLVLNPYNADTIYNLAFANYELWKRKINPKYKRKAERYAKRCIDIMPQYEQAIELISELRNANTFRIFLQRYKFYLIIAGVILFYVITNLNDKTDTQTEQKQTPERKTEQTTENKKQPEKQKQPENVKANDKDVALPVHLLKNEQARHFKLNTNGLFVDPRKDYLNFKLKGSFVGDKAGKYRAVKAKIAFVDAQNRIVAADLRRFSCSPVSNIIPFRFSKSQKFDKLPVITKANIDIQLIEKRPNYREPEKIFAIAPEWGITKPEDIELKISKLVYSENTSPLKGEIFVENLSQSKINLQIEYQWKDTNGKLVKSESEHLNNLKPYEIRYNKKTLWIREQTDLQPFDILIVNIEKP